MLLGFQSYFNQQLNEEATAGGGILHLEHPADLHFDGEQGTAHALKTLRGVVSGKTPITRKVDDKTSVKLKVDMDGKVGAGYKGASSPYAYSDADVDKHYKDKPYAGALKAIIANAKKVLPNRVGEWQGGFLSTPETRQTDGNSISHTPNTIKYAVPRRSPEGKKLAQSKVSMVVHTELTGPNREPTPVLNTSEFREHPDVHLMSHVVPESEKAVLPEHAKKANEHLDAAEALLEGHDHSHMAGHETTMRQYINSLVETGTEANAKGYSKFLKGYHDKKIEKLKTEKGKAGKIAARDAALANVKGNAKAFDRSFKIHHHLQQATNALAKSLGQTAHGGYEHTFADSDVKTGPEGFVAKEADGVPLKVVDRSPEGFAAANRARSARFKKPTVQESVISGIVKAIKTYSKPAAETVKKVQPVEKAQSAVVRKSTEKTPAAIIKIEKK